MTIPTQQRPHLLPCLDINLDRLLAVRRQDIRHLVWNFPESTLGLTDLLRCMLLDVQFCVVNKSLLSDLCAQGSETLTPCSQLTVSS